jgi:integrase
MKQKLTPGFCQNATAKGRARMIYWDAELPGFGLSVTASGHRSYVVQYRSAGISRRATIDGRLKLAEARKQARAILGEVARGRDPMAEKRAAAALTEDTFASVAESYMKREAAKEDGKRLRTLVQRRRMLDRLILPALGARPIGAIVKSEIVRLLDRIEDENGATTADRTLALVGKIMNWHESRHDEFRSPIRRLPARAPTKEHARSRVLTDDELRAVWRAAETHPGPYGAFVTFAILTACRRSEASGMRREEVSSEGDGTLWTLPASRNKVKVDLVRPLSPAALAVIEQLPKIGKRGLVFSHNGRQQLGGFSDFKKRFDRACGVEDWTFHDLRRTARSLMSRAGVLREHAELCLGHLPPNIVTTYDRWSFLPEKRAAYEKLAGLVERIVHPEPNVVPLRGA